MRTVFLSLALAGSLLAPGLASAAQPPTPATDRSIEHTQGGARGIAGEEGIPAEHAGPPENGVDRADGHGGQPHDASAPDAAHEGDAHEGGHEGGEHHVTYTDDDDGDGTANWLDSDSPGYVLVKLTSQAIAFVVVMGILFSFARRPILDFLADRALVIRKQIQESAQAKADAEQRAAEIQSRLGNLERELTQLRADAEAESRAEEARLVERAHEEGRRIGQVAERKIRDEVVRAQVALRQEAVDLAVKLAENTLRTSVNSADQQRLARDFLDSLKSGADVHG